MSIFLLLSDVTVINSISVFILHSKPLPSKPKKENNMKKITVGVGGRRPGSASGLRRHKSRAVDRWVRNGPTH